jgi:hypothetical protein
MNQETLRLLIRHKIQDGRLPQDTFSKVWGSPGDRGLCVGCERIITTGQPAVEGIVMEGGSPLLFHFRCFDLWDDERHATHERGHWWLRPLTTARGVIEYCRGMGHE